jgi:hypothetical protein
LIEIQQIQLEVMREVAQVKERGTR